MASSEVVDIETQMLNALELLHYSYRFRNSCFALAFLPETSIEELELDLRLLQAARIKTFLMCTKQSSPRSLLRAYNARWSNFVSLKKDGADLAIALERALSDGKTPLITLENGIDPHALLEHGEIFELAGKFKVDKLFLVSAFEGLVVDGKFRSHLTLAELEIILQERRQFNLSTELLASIARQAKGISAEVVMLCAKPGSLYEEIFTHQGKGTLLTSDYPNELRAAELSDAHEIALLMRPYIRSGAVLPLDEDHIAAEIGNYSLHTVNQQIVAIAKLSEYGEAAEIGKIVTLPRYQGQGRARELINLLIATARKQHKKYVFSLSINPTMWSMYNQLGFQEVQREILPQSWKAAYDFNRPSRAFVKELLPRI